MSAPTTTSLTTEGGFPRPGNALVDLFTSEVESENEKLRAQVSKLWSELRTRTKMSDEMLTCITGIELPHPVEHL